MTIKENYIKYLKNLIAQDKIGLAIEKIKALSNEETDFENESIIQSLRFKSLLEKIRLGVIDSTSANVDKNQIATSLLSLLDSINESNINFFNIELVYLNDIPFLDPSKLIGREEELIEISKLLSSYPNNILVSGIGGIGKTSLIMSCINDFRYYNKYSHIAWVTVSESFQKSVVFALILKITDGSLKIIKSKIQEHFENIITYLKKLNGRNLLVIDNFNDHEELLFYKTKIESLRWHVIITSRSMLNEFETIKIRPLSFRDSKKLFYRFYKKEIDDFNLKKVLELINYHTLLIELIGKAANENPKLNIEKLYDELSEKGLKARELQMKIYTKHGERLYSKEELEMFQYLLMIFDISNLSRTEKQCLRYFTLLSTRRYHLEFLFSQFNTDFNFVNILNCFHYRLIESDINKDSSFILELIRILIRPLKLLRYFKEIRKTNFFNSQISDQVDLINILNSLVKKGWLQKEEGFFSQHSLIKTVIKEKLKATTVRCAVLGYERHDDINPSSPKSRVQVTLIELLRLKKILIPKISGNEISKN